MPNRVVCKPLRYHKRLIDCSLITDHQYFPTNNLVVTVKQFNSVIEAASKLLEENGANGTPKYAGNDIFF